MNMNVYEDALIIVGQVYSNVLTNEYKCINVPKNTTLNYSTAVFK